MNKVTIAQVLGMARYEFRMHWRRRALIILLWSVLVVTGITTLVAGDSFVFLRSPQIDPAVAREGVTAFLILSTFSSIGIGMVFILPILAAETIPLDRQNGVRELLDTLPLSPNTYLIGKLLGLWAAVLSAMGLIMLVIGALWWFKAGAFNISDYAEAWIVGIGSIVVLNGSIGVLIPATQPNRRRAILVTAVGLVILLWLFGGMTDTIDARGMLSIVRAPILNYYLFIGAKQMNSAPSTVTVPTFETVLLTIGIGLVQIAVLFGLVRLWMAWLYSRR